MEHEIIVIKKSKSYQVLPPCPIICRNDTIVWRNYTGSDIEVLLPTTFPAAKKEAGQKGELTVTVLGNAPPGFYPYAVYSVEANDMAVGNSAPGVIIKR